MSRRRLVVSIALVGGIFLLAGALYFDRAELVVTDVKSNRVLLRVPVLPGDRFTLSYLHSVAKSRVSGTFEVTPDYSIAVKETAFGSFGPGLPDLRPGDDYEVSGGLIRQKNLDQVIESLLFRVHPYTEHVLEFRGQRLELSKSVRAGGGIVIFVRPPLFQRLRWHWGQA